MSGTANTKSLQPGDAKAILKVAAAAECDPRTVRRVVRGKTTRIKVTARIRAAAAGLGYEVPGAADE
jgi:hypothetical protein